MVYELWLYLGAIFENWLDEYWILTAVPEVFTWIMPSYAERWTASLDHKVSPETRQRIYRVLFLAGFFIAGFFAWDEQYRIVQTKTGSSLQVQFDAQQKRLHDDEGKFNLQQEQLFKQDDKISVLEAQNNANRDLFNRVMALTKPGIISDSLQIGAQLLDCTTGILVLAGAHHRYDQFQPTQGLPPEWAASITKTRQLRYQQVEDAHKQAAEQGAALLDDYRRHYANQIVSLRDSFIQFGYRDWQPRDFYPNPQSVQNIQQIASELLHHAREPAPK